MALDSSSEKAATINLEMLLSVHTNVQEQIRFADTKAGFIAGMNTLLVGFLAPQLNRLADIASSSSASGIAACVAVVLLIAYGVATAASFGLVIAAIVSRLGGLAPRCRIFFGHITSSYGKDYARYHDEVANCTDDDWAKDISSQIVEASCIASAKHRLVVMAAYASAIALLCWGGTLVALAFLGK